ncbi:ankyrin repeat protein [Megavirus baoshan]|uniref:Ankyrin repeat protein n=1 Tax=Megavirus baoshan TaxID=2496520 RepID=A0A3Q8U8Z8_9VIRU|nr:ankyrin repeat protein [Megavirus baoshan]AZL89821.1 ankyrin repeat protein [Megavirus baoshan]
MNLSIINKSYSCNKIYPCNDIISCNNFSKLMYLIIHEYKIYGGYKIIKKYINKNKKKINYQNNYGYTALMIAIMNYGNKCSYRTIKLLLKSGADIIIYANYNENAVSIAIKNYSIHRNLDMIKILLSYYPDFLDNCFDYTFSRYNFEALKNAHPDIISLLVQMLPNIDKILLDGYTYLMNAIMVSNYKLIYELLKNGCDVNITYNNGMNALIACGWSDIENIDVYETIIKNGCNINHQDNNGDTVLHILLKKIKKNINIDIIKLLLKSGLDINIKNNKRSTALIKACKYSRLFNIKQIVELLLQNGAKINDGHFVTPLIKSSIYSWVKSDIQTIKLLLQYGADINQTNFLGCHALMFAARYADTTSCIDTVKFLLDNDANVNLQDSMGYTALMYASKYSITSNRKVICMLLDYGANINLLEHKGNNALLLSAINKNNISNFYTIKTLLTYGSNYLVSNEDGRTLFSYINRNEIVDCFNIIKQIENTKSCLQKVLKQYITVIENKFYQPDSFRVKLLSINWNIQNNDYVKIIKLNNLELFDYFGIFDIDSLRTKILDTVKNMN